MGYNSVPDIIGLSLFV